MFNGFTYPISKVDQSTRAISLETNPGNNVSTAFNDVELSRAMNKSATEDPRTLYVFVFYGNHCPACIRYKQQRAPAIHARHPYVKFVYVDTADSSLRRFMNTQGIEAIPTFLFVKGGTVAAKIRGFDQEEMEAKLNTLRSR